MASKLTAADMLILIILVVGGLNWGLIGFFNFNLVEKLFGQMILASKIIYCAVGVSSVYTLYIISKLTRRAN